MTVTLKYEAKKCKWNGWFEPLTICPYNVKIINPMIGSMACEECKYHKEHNKKNKTVDCSYEYDHLTEEEKRSIHENI